MNSDLKAITNAFAMNAGMFSAIVCNVPENLSGSKIHDNTNEFNRIALHLLLSRHNLGTLLEMELAPLPWSNLGEGMVAGFLPESEVPSLREILDAWKRCAFAFHQKILSVATDVLNKPSPFPLPGNHDATLEDFVILSVTHEAYHIGQLGLISKAVTGTSLLQLLMSEMGNIPLHESL